MKRFASAAFAVGLCLVTSGGVLPPRDLRADEEDLSETASARVEAVFATNDRGFQFIAYSVTYRGAKVIVEDPLCSTDYAVGDKIYFLVMRHDMSKDHPGGKKLLSFLIH